MLYLSGHKPCTLPETAHVTPSNKGLARRVADLLKVAMLLTWKSMDVLPDDDRFAARPRSIACSAANFTRQNLDRILVVGARLDIARLALNQENFSRALKNLLVHVGLAPRLPRKLFSE